MALLDYCELLALLRMEEVAKKEERKCETDDILRLEEMDKKGENEKERKKFAKDDILKEEELKKEALREASVLGDSALYRCHKKCARIKQLTGGIFRQE